MRAIAVKPQGIRVSDLLSLSFPPSFTYYSTTMIAVHTCEAASLQSVTSVLVSPKQGFSTHSGA